MFKNTASLHPRTSDLTGKTFGRLYVISFDKYKNVGKFSSAYWNVKCECGTKKSVQARFLKNGLTVSCGCFQAERAREINKKPPGVAGFNKLFNTYKLGARNRNLCWELTKEQAKELFQQNCYYCGSPPNQQSKTTDAAPEFIYNGIDRINNTLGYSQGNCVPCCSTCNYAKRDMEYDEFVCWIARIYRHLRQSGKVEVNHL